MAQFKRPRRAGILGLVTLLIAYLVQLFAPQLPGFQREDFQGSLPIEPIMISKVRESAEGKDTSTSTKKMAQMKAMNYAYALSNFKDPDPAPRERPPSTSYPAALFIFSAVMIVMAFYNMMLRANKFSWRQWLSFQDKISMAVKAFRTNRLFGILLPALSDKDNPLPAYSRPRPIRGSRNKPLLMTLALLSSSAMATNLQLNSEKSTRNQLRKYRGPKGMLATNQLPSDLRCLLGQNISADLEVFSEVARQHSDILYAIADTGASCSCTNDVRDFEPGTLVKLDQPKVIGGIAGGVTVQYEGMIRWETLDDNGNVIIFRTKGLLAESLPCRLFSPQSFLTESQNLDDHFRVYGDRSEWHMFGQKLLTLKYDGSFLPRMTMFRRGTTTATLTALQGNVLDERNHNLSPLRRIWAMWHFRLGHLGFAHVRQLGSMGFLDKAGLGLLRSSTDSIPKCAACQFGKASRKPSGTIHIERDKDSEGNLKKDKLEPGQMVFMDQLESRTRGRLFHTSGREHQVDKFKGSTIFCDAASGLLHVEHQVTFTANETIQSKVCFERMAAEHGTLIQNYHTDNGVFQSRDFMNEIAASDQAIKFSGVGAKWQNGVAENSIKIAVSRARTMMIHASLNWPDEYEESLWPMAVSYAVHLYNHTPNRESGIAPIEVFTRTLSNYQALRNAHVWGSPAYVLEPRLTDSGGKLPKWQPRSRLGQFVGVSPLHAENINLIRNVRTGYMSPQYHTVIDEWFETVSSADLKEEPKCWEQLTIFQRYQTTFDEADTAPNLADEWLTVEEIKAKQQSRLSNPYGRRVSQDSHSKDDKEDRTFTSPRTPSKSKPSPVPGSEAIGSSPNPARLLPPPSPGETSVPPREPQAPPREASPSSPTSMEPIMQPPTSEPRSRYNLRDRASSISILDPATGKTISKPVKYTGTRIIGTLATALLMTANHACGQLTQHLLYCRAIGTDPHTGFIDSFHPCSIQSEFALKAKAVHDPDLPSMREALTGNHAKEFFKAMDKEIADLQSMGTWKIVSRASLEPTVKVIPGTWSYRKKRYPDGRFNKCKARFCVRGDLMEKDVHFTGSIYFPTVGWQLFVPASC